MTYKRIGINIDMDVVNEVDSIRGMIPRSRFVNAALAEKVEQIRENGGVIGQI